MASRRKSGTPCMLPSREERPSGERAADAGRSHNHEDSGAEGAHEIDYEELETHDALRRPGRDKSTREPATEDAASPVETARVEDPGRKGIALSKTPIMRSRPEPKKFAASRQTVGEEFIEVGNEDEEETDEYRELPAPPVATAARLVPVSAPLQIQTGTQSFLVNGADVLNGALPVGALAQVLSVLQKRNQMQLLIPVSSIPTYDAAMDGDVLLLGAYNRFPYPAPSETEALAARTGFAEENVKLWFSAQRLKRGVSWTPEEVEEARRKKSNGAAQTLRQSPPPTIAVIPVRAAADGVFRTCRILGGPGLVLAPPPGGASLPAAAPGEKAAEGAEPQAQKAQSSCASKPKKSKEQLAELKASYGRRRVATEAEISRLMRVTGLSKRAIKKWFSDTRYNQRNSREPRRESAAAEGDAGEEASGPGEEPAAPLPVASSPVTPSPAVPAERRGKLRHAFPDFTPQKFKEKTSGQLLILESSFRKSRTPSDEEVARLRAQTKLTRREVDAWFSDRRKGRAREAGVPPSGRRALKKTPAQLDVLKKAFVRSRRPTARDYDRMAEDSGLPRSYVVNWFGETRYAVKNGSLKWFDLYCAGKARASPDGAARMPKKSKKRFRGRSGKSRRPCALKREADAPGQAKSGKAFLRAYFLQRRDPSRDEERPDDSAAGADVSARKVGERREDDDRGGADRDPERPREEEPAPSPT
nr:zinc fingers and homeoboxes protein 1-like [Nerophis lumbriciformis]